MAPPPDDYGWAYIDPQRATASADGPSGSLQFRWGSDDLIPGKFSGSADLVFYPSSDDHKGGGHAASGSSLYLYGDMFVNGGITARTYTVRHVNSTEVDVSGSTRFGDSADDTHQRTGSLEVSGPANFTSEINAESHLQVSGAAEMNSTLIVDGTADFNSTVTIDGLLTATGGAVIGNASGDTHQVTGSFEVSGPAHLASTLSVTGAVSPLTSSGEIHASRLVSNDIFTSGSVGIGTSVPTDQPAEKNDLVIGNHTGNRGMTIASAGGGVGTIRFSPGTSANSGEGWIDYSNNTKKFRLGTDGLTTRVVVHSVGTQVTGTLEVSSNTNIAGNAKFGYNNEGTGSTSVTTFYNTLSGANGAGGGGDIHADKIFANDIYLSGSSTGITATFVSASLTDAAAGTSTDPRSYSYAGFEAGGPTGYLKASGSLTLGGEAQIGTLFKMPDNTAAKILVADGTSFQEVAVSGDVSISSAGAVTIAAGAVEHGMLADDIISGQAELVHAEIADADELMISDAGTIKRVGVDSLRDHYFGVVSGDATIADGGALTIAADAVEPSMMNIFDDSLAATNTHFMIADGTDYSSFALSGDVTCTNAGVVTIAADAVHGSMLNDDVISAQQNLGDATVAQGDELLLSDDGTIKAVTFSNLEDSIFGNVSGDATVAAGGALTIAANAVEGSMINSNAAGVGIVYAANALSLDLNELTAVDVDVSADFVAIVDASDSNSATRKESIADIVTAVAGNGLGASSGVMAVNVDDSSIEIDSDSLRVKATGITNAMLAGSIADSKLSTITTANKVDIGAINIDGANDINAALVDADLIIVDDGAGGSNRKSAMSRVKTYTKTDVGSVGTVEANKAIIVDGSANINSGLASVTGSATLLFADIQGETSIQSRGTLGVSGSATIAAGLSSSMGMAIPDNEHLRFGTGNDLKIFHNGSNNLFVGQTGHMRFDNQATGKHIQMDLGADDATTQFQIRNNSGTDLLTVDTVGTEITGTLEVSSTSNLHATNVFGALSGSSTLSAHGAAHIGGTLTMDGAGIVFNVANSAGTVNLQVNDGSGADTAITLGKNGKVTKIGDDTPTDGQYLSWDASGGKVAWSDGTTPDMSGSDNHYSSTEIRTSGDLKVSGSVTLGGISAGTPASSLFLGLDSNNNIVKAAAGGDWVLEDDDGTEVTVSANKEVKFIGSGITTNWTDTSDGSDGDPYDLTFTVDAAQTGITSILAAGIKIGEDNETKIDFGTNDEIRFFAANAHEVTLAANTLKPATADGIALGAADAEWSDLYLAESGIVYLGNDQDVHLIHDPDSGLIIKRTATGDNNPTNLTIQTGEQGISGGNVLGRLRWQAPDESNGGNGATIAAQIECRASASWNASTQRSSLVFNTAEDGTLTPWMELEYDGNLTGSNWEVNQHGTGSFSELNVWGRIMGAQDSGNDTWIDLKPNYVAFHAGTTSQPQLTITQTEVVINEGSSGAQDFRVESNGDTHAFFVDASDGTNNIKFAGGFGSSGVTIGATGSMNLDGHVMATGDLVTAGDLHVSDDAFITDDCTVGGDLTVTGDIIATSATPSFAATTVTGLTVSGDITVDDDIIHTGDADTKIAFTTDQIDFIAGGRTFMTLDETTQDTFKVNPGGQDVDFFVGSNQSTGSIKVDGATGDIHFAKSQMVFDHSECMLRIRPDDTSTQAKIVLHSKDTTSADNAEINFRRYTDGSLGLGDNLGAIRFQGSEDEDGDYYSAAAIIAEVDESSWTDDDSTAGRLLFYTTKDGNHSGTEHMRLASTGHLGIGNTSPSSPLSVDRDASAAYVARFRQHHSSGYGIRIRSNDTSSGRFVTFSKDDGTNGGHITMNATTVSYGAFTGYHPAALPAADHDTGYEYGTIVKIASVDSTTYEKSVIYNVEKTTAAQDKAALGVWAGKMGECFNDDGTPDRESGMHQIFSIGDGHILVCSEGGNIETGDFICSSNTDGHGMLQPDDLLHNYTVARASEPVDWSTEDSNTKLIACTYHAG